MDTNLTPLDDLPEDLITVEDLRTHIRVENLTGCVIPMYFGWRLEEIDLALVTRAYDFLRETEFGPAPDENLT